MKKDKIIPSVLEKKFENVEKLISVFSAFASRVEIDICDGKLVKNLSWPFSEMSGADFAKLSRDEFADLYLPAWEEVSFTAHLMCEKPEEILQTIAYYGFDTVVVQFRSIRDEKHWKEILEICQNFELEINLCIELTDNFADFLKFAKKHAEEFVRFQVMSISEIGFQGKGFSEKSLEVVKNLRENFAGEIEKEIVIDGGINDENILKCVEAGADKFTVGSFLVKSLDAKESFKALKDIL